MHVTCTKLTYIGTENKSTLYMCMTWELIHTSTLQVLFFPLIWLHVDSVKNILRLESRIGFVSFVLYMVICFTFGVLFLFSTFAVIFVNATRNPWPNHSATTIHTQSNGVAKNRQTTHCSQWTGCILNDYVYSYALAFAVGRTVFAIQPLQNSQFIAVWLH